MKIEIHLKRVLQQHNMDNHGITQKIARDLGVHRHTIGKLYKNAVSNISLSLLGKLCDWLIDNGVDRQQLPNALIGSCPDSLWQAVARPGRVTIYLGEYQELTKGSTIWRWLSKSDDIVATRFVESLSTPTTIGVSAPTVRTEYVPFRWDTQSPAPVQKPFPQTVKIAGRIFEQMHASVNRTAIIIGSQRVNSLLEYFVADLFGAAPFTPAIGKAAVPFYLLHRNGDHAVESCFGGLGNPPGHKGRPAPGIYHLDAAGKWVFCPWKLNEQGLGIVLMQWDPGLAKLEMAVFGYSGRCTAALGAWLAHPQAFSSALWPPPLAFGGRSVGIHILRITYQNDDSLHDLKDSSAYPAASDIEIINLDETVVSSFLR